jgi:hypothetical protein
MPADAAHGQPVTYDWWGCRCAECRDAHRIYRKRLREGRQPAAKVRSLGTARRLQALAALGYSFRDLAAHLAVTPRRVSDMAGPRDPYVLRETAALVAEVFERLAATPGSSRYALTVARRSGWLPPLAWDDIDDPDEVPGLELAGGSFVDEVAVERALNGERVELTDGELLDAARVGVARGMTPWAISVALRMNVFSVNRLLAGELPPRRAKRAARTAGVAS